jgi:hypothetical protein
VHTGKGAHMDGGWGCVQVEHGRRGACTGWLGGGGGKY